MQLWDRLLAQAESTLNMLRQTNIAPKISAYAYTCEQHNFHKMPLASMSCAVLLKNKPDTRKTWDDHAMDGYYIEISREQN